MSLIVQPHERPALSAFHRAAVNLGAALGGVIVGISTPFITWTTPFD